LHHLRQEIWRQGALIYLKKQTYLKIKWAIELYLERIQETPTHVWAICEQMQFQENMVDIYNAIISSFASFTKDKGSKFIDQNE